MWNKAKINQDVHEGAASDKRMMEIYRREKELAERKLVLLRRKLEMVRNAQTESEARSEDGQQVPGLISSASVSQSPTHMSITRIADLLNSFDGNINTYDTWEKQLLFLKDAYKLEEDATKILVGMRLKEKALEWFHLKPDYIQMQTSQL